MAAPIFADGTLRRTRFRRQRLSSEERETILHRVLRFAEQDRDDRTDDRERRLQRYAKFRQWTEGKDWPWEGASDIALPDIAEAVLGITDTLVNAVLSTRPVVGANAIRSENSDKEKSIDKVLDTQLFVEQPGEKIVEELAEPFVLDGNFVAYIPWIRERKPVTDIRIFDRIPAGAVPVGYLQQLLEQEFPGQDFFRANEEGWDYRIESESPDEPDSRVSFYTRADDQMVEMLIRHEVLVFDGPRIIVKDYEDVLVPPRVANLQPPGPSNPGGAPHVILVDYPTVEEVRSLQRQGFYDLLSKEDANDLGLRSRDDSRDEAKKQKDAMAGVQDNQHKTDADKRASGTLTRLMCFDIYDLDGDGRPEDVIFWVLLEDKKLLKAMALTELFPADPPRRPLAEAQFLPVKGRFEGIGLPELMEGMHDFLKATLDQGIDGGTLATTPFFFYRAASSLKPEILRPWPGDGIPLSEPQRDVLFPQIPFDGSFSLNAFFTGRQLEERLTLQGDLQAGRVPQGKSSALRTAQGINTILAQGEARPERILRRFFMGFVEIFRQMHELNQHFYPREKKIRVLGVTEAGDDPYLTVTRDRDLKGRFVFDFRASVLNASKVAKQQGLEILMSRLINPLMLQLGVIGPEEIYRMSRDLIQATSNDPDRYSHPPTPGAERRRLTAKEALSIVFDHMAPDGLPAEGAESHIAGLQQFMASDDFGLFDQSQVNLLQAWLKQMQALLQQERQQEQLSQAAQDFQRQIGGGQGGNGAAPTFAEPGTRTGPNEVLDETLPSNNRGIG